MYLYSRYLGLKGVPLLLLQTLNPIEPFKGTPLRNPLKEPLKEPEGTLIGTWSLRAKCLVLSRE